MYLMYFLCIVSLSAHCTFIVYVLIVTIYCSVELSIIISHSLLQAITHTTLHLIVHITR